MGKKQQAPGKRTKEERGEAEERAQWTKYLLCKNESLILDPQNPGRRQREWPPASNPTAQKTNRDSKAELAG